MKDKLKLVILGTYIISYVIYTLKVINNNEVIYDIKKMIDSNIKFYTIIILMSIIFAIVVFFIEYIIIKFIVNKVEKIDNNDILLVGLLICDTAMVNFGLIMSMIGQTLKISYLCSILIGPLILLFLLKEKFSKKQICIVVTVKLTLYLSNIIFVLGEI